MAEPTTEEPDCPLCGGCGELLASTQRDSQDKIACPQCAAADLKELYQQTLAYLSRQVEEMRERINALIRSCDGRAMMVPSNHPSAYMLNLFAEEVRRTFEPIADVLSSTAPSETEKSASLPERDDGWVRVDAEHPLPVDKEILAALPVYHRNGSFLRFDMHVIFVDPETGSFAEDYGWEAEDYEYWREAPTWPEPYRRTAGERK